MIKARIYFEPVEVEIHEPADTQEKLINNNDALLTYVGKNWHELIAPELPYTSDVKIIATEPVDEEDEHAECEQSEFASLRLKDFE